MLLEDLDTLYKHPTDGYLYFDYFTDGTKNKVGPTSTVWGYTDYEYCDKYGNIIVGEIEMERDVNYIGGEYKIVEVVYELEGPELKSYNFKADIDMDISEGDIVVVESTRGLSLTKVLNTYENNLQNADRVKKATAWVVDKVDMTNQNKRKEATERVEYLKAQLEERKQRIKAINMYQLLAEADPVAAKLLQELKEVTNENI